MIKDSIEKQTDDVILATALKRASSLMGISNSSLAKIQKLTPILYPESLKTE